MSNSGFDIRGVSLSEHIGRQYRALFKSEIFIYIGILAVMFTFIIIPISMMVQGAFTNTPPYEPSYAYTIETYQTLVSQSWFNDALINTMIVAGGAMVFGVSLGVLLSWIMIRTNTPYVNRLEILVIMPFFLSPFIMAIAWTLLAGGDVGLLNSPFKRLFDVAPLNVYTRWGIIWVFMLYYSPFAYLIVGASMRNMNTEMEEAARMAGASTLKTLRTITLPILAPSIVAASLLIFVAAAGQFGAPMILGSQQRIWVLPTRIFMEVRQPPINFNLAASLGILLMAIAIVLLYIRSKIIGARDYVTVGGESGRVKKYDIGRWKWVSLLFVLSYILIAVILPLFFIIFASFLRYFSTSPHLGLVTLDNWYWILFEYPTSMTALQNSLMLAIGGAFIGMVFCVLISWVVLRTDLPGTRLIDSLATLPIAVPGIVMGLAYMFGGLRSPVPIYGTLVILGLAYISNFIPYGVRSTTSAMRQIDSSLEEVARMSGASLYRTYKDVTFPLLKPGFASGYIILYVIFMRELSISVLLYSPGNEVLSVVIFDLWNDGMFTQLATIATLQLVATFTGLLILSKFLGINVSGAVKRGRGG